MRERLRSAGRTVASVRRHNPDYHIMMYAAILVIIGLIIIFAIGPQRANVMNESFGSSLSGMYFVIKQALSVVFAIVAFFAFAFFVKVDWLLKYRTYILWFGVGASVLLFLMGNIMNAKLGIGAMESVTQCALGACRWFILPGIGTLQPAEFLKLGLVLQSSRF